MMGKPEGENPGGKRKNKAKMYYQKQKRDRSSQQGDGKGPNNNQKTGFYRPRKLEIGMKGFLCTTNLNEKNAVKEAYNLLNEYHDVNEELTQSSGEVNSGTQPTLVKGGSEGIEGKDDPRGTSTSSNDTTTPLVAVADGNKNLSKNSEMSDDDDDVESAIAAEISQLKSPDVKFKFQSVDTGVPHLIFISTTMNDPAKLTYKILSDLSETKVQKSRFLQRMVPVEVTCGATILAIEKAAEAILPKYFKTGFNSFQVVYKSRYNNTVERGEVIKAVADVVMKMNSFNSVNLNEPKLSIVVEIMRGLCCIGVLPKFNELRKYNLIEVTTTTPDKPQ